MNSRLTNALKAIPSSISVELSNIVLADDFDATISETQFNRLLKLSNMEGKALRLALLPLAAAYAHAPISKFYVGSIVRGLSGRIYFGANMELPGAQLGQTIHAEQSGIAHAWMKGEMGIKDITINYTPCGHCRQFMNETTTAQEMMIQLPEREAQPLINYLPDSFGPQDLGINERLMDNRRQTHKTSEAQPLIAQAVEALNMSHAPYTQNFSGIALALNDGKVFTGAYAENAAFNPSLPPLQVALVQVFMAGYSLVDIQTAALAEMTDGQISHLADTQSTLETVNPDIPVNYIAL